MKSYEVVGINEELLAALVFALRQDGCAAWVESYGGFPGHYLQRLTTDASWMTLCHIFPNARANLLLCRTWEKAI